MIMVLVRVHDEQGKSGSPGTKKILVHLIAMKTKPLILFVLATVAAFATTSSGQNASPSGTLPPKRNQKPASVHISPKLTAIPSRAPTKNVVSRKKEDKHVTYAEALGRYRHERHDRVWWKQHHVIIVLVAGGYYYWDSGYWCPAWGYDPAHESYDYDGPIYTYGNLLPDQVIINVQHALKELGYYMGDVNGSLGPASRQALSAYQRDYGLEVTPRDRRANGPGARLDLESGLPEPLRCGIARIPSWARNLPTNGTILLLTTGTSRAKRLFFYPCTSCIHSLINKIARTRYGRL